MVWAGAYLKHGGRFLKASCTSPWLTVILPVYQGEKYLDAALASIADQGTTDDLEILAVDDGSTDSSADILLRWSERLPIKLISKPHGGNWVRSTNLALARARGTWVSLLHQDDYWLSDRLLVLRDAVDANPEVDVWLHPAHFFDEVGKKVGCWRCPFPRGKRLRAGEILPRLVLQNTIPIVSPLIRRACIDAAGDMDASLWYYGDWDFWLRLASQASFYYLATPLAAFRIHPCSQTAKRTVDVEEIGRQFDVTVTRALASPAFPPEARSSTLQVLPFSRAMYLFLLSGLHRKGKSIRTLFQSAFRAGPLGLWRYWRYSCLWDRLWPRYKLYIASRRRGQG